MARYLVHHNPSSGFRKDRQRYKFDVHPVPTIMGQAKGIGGDNDSHWWIEEDELPESPVDATKPPYRVPSMEEVAKLRGTNGLKLVSTFSGCGGSCLGFEMAGYEVLWASEFVPAAREVYALNHPGVILDDRDIRDVKPGEILKAIGMHEGELDVLEGSPPCANFSTAGKRQKSWGKVKSYSDTEQRSDDLFFEFARLLKGIQPRAFVAENVSGLVKGVAKGYFIEILKALKDCGYRVEAQLLDAQWLGVPQARKRIIFMGVRNDLERDPAFPLPLPYRYSIRDALPWLTAAKSEGHGYFEGGPIPVDRPAPTVATGPGSAAYNGHAVEGKAKLVHHDPTSGFSKERKEWDVAEHPAPTVNTQAFGAYKTPSHWWVEGSEEIVGVGDNGGFGKGAMRSPDLPASTLGASPNTGNGKFPSSMIEVRKLDAAAEDSLDRYAIGVEWDKLRPGESSNRYPNLVRAAEGAPCPTVTAAGAVSGLASVTHPTEKRKFTIAELRRLCAFPDDFQLTGSYAQQWERLGRAVPPLMMRAVAESLRDGVLLK